MTTTKVKQHTHHDTIIEWAKDPSKTLQYRVHPEGEWVDITPGVGPTWNSNLEYRLKPNMVIITYRKALVKTPSGYRIINAQGPVMHSLYPERIIPSFVKWVSDIIVEEVQV